MKVDKSKLPLLLPGHAFEILTAGNTAWLARTKLPGPHVGRPPCIDDPEDTMPDETHDPVPDWTKENSVVQRAHWTTFTSKDEAMAYFQKQYGHIYQDLSTAKWWAVRVPKRSPK